MNSRFRVLVAEDEPAQATLIEYNLKAAGFEVSIAGDGLEALMLIEANPPDLLVLDWMLPEISGIELCRRLRSNRDTQDIPIVMLTARGEEDDRIRGLDVGADDYMVKPYSPAELVARIKAILRRLRPNSSEDKLEFHGIVLDHSARKVVREGKSVHLTPSGFRILQALMERPGRVLSREQLINLAWGANTYVEDRTVDVHIKRLRKALELDGEPDVIRTVRGFGYVLDAVSDLS